MQIKLINKEINVEYNNNGYSIIGVDGQINLQKMYELISFKEIDSDYIKNNLSFDDTIELDIREGLKTLLIEVFTENDKISDEI